MFNSEKALIAQMTALLLSGAHSPTRSVIVAAANTAAEICDVVGIEFDPNPPAEPVKSNQKQAPMGGIPPGERGLS